MEARAAAGGRPPSDIEPLLPWNLTHQRRQELTNHAGPAALLDGL